jgi:CRP-like cAMP-binding protein
VTDKVRFLTRLNLFEGMGREEIETVARELTMRRWRRGSLIGDGHGDRVYLLKEGRVRLYRLDPDGHEVTTAVLVPGQLFGLSALFGRGQEPLLAECLDDSYICEAGAHDFLEMLGRHPVMMARVMMAMARQILHLEQAMEQLARDPARSRLARHLLSAAEEVERTDEGYSLPAQTQEEMAKVIATARETVARTLGAWRREGIIISRGRAIVIPDLNRLRQEVGHGDD